MKNLRCTVGWHDRFHWGVMATGKEQNLPSRYIWRCSRCDLSEVSGSRYKAGAPYAA